MAHYISPTGKISEYRYQYLSGNQIIQGDIIEYQTKFYKIGSGKSGDEENPKIELINIESGEYVTTRVSEIIFVCSDKSNECKCRYHCVTETKDVSQLIDSYQRLKILNEELCFSKEQNTDNYGESNNLTGKHIEKEN
jgi:hypothetical protein